MKKVFLAWSGENKIIAEKLSVLLYGYGLQPVVGGQDAKTMMVANQIINHMDDCEFAILLIEKNNNNAVSGNVMFEWGYLLHKLNEPSRIQAFLINMKSGELPSDVAGCWADELTKREVKDEEEKNLEFDRLASEAYTKFIDHYSKHTNNLDKLSYFDNWENNKHLILNFTNTEQISEILLYGMQATIYSGKYDILLNKLRQILGAYPNLNGDLKHIIRCSCAILDVFSSTKRLTKPLDDESYDSLTENLEIPYEKNISNPDLAAWCEIFRTDKLELCAEMFASSQEHEELKKAYYLKAVEYCELVLNLLDKQIENNPSDTNYALLYRAFANRNLFQIYKQLNIIQPCDKYAELMQQHCNETLLNRKTLFNHYLSDRDQNCIAMHYITQEYILALTEQYQFESDPLKMHEIKRKIKQVFHKWSEENEISNMIFNKIKNELKARNLLEEV